MSAYAITSDIVSITKTSKDTLLIKPHSQYVGTELDDEKMNKLYATYCGLLMMQHAEDGDKEQNNDKRTMER